MVFSAEGHARCLRRAGAAGSDSMCACACRRAGVHASTTPARQPHDREPDGSFRNQHFQQSRYQMTTLWSGRFDQAPDAAAFECSSFSFDRRLFEDDGDGKPGVARDSLAPACCRLRKRPPCRRPSRRFSNSVVRTRRSSTETTKIAQLRRASARRTAAIRASAPAHRTVAQTNRSFDLRLYLRRRIPAPAAGGRRHHRCADAAGAYCRRRADAVVLPHFRPAQPVLVAHFLLAHAAPLRRDFERLEMARQEAGALTLGSSAIAGTSYAVDVEGDREGPGFERIVANSIDASSDRDFCRDLRSCLRADDGASQSTG